MSKKIISLVLCLTIILTSACMFVSCGNKEYPVKVGEVTLKAEPTNVVVLGKNLVDIISCIGYDGKVAGRSDDVNQLGFDVVPSVGTASTPDVSLVENAGADLVLAESTLSEDVKAQLDEKNITVITFDEADTLEEVEQLYITIGKILGGNITGAQKGAEGFADLTETLDLIYESASTGNSTEKTICYLYLENDTLMALIKDAWETEVLGYSYTVNVMENAESKEVDKDMLMLANPDCVFCDDQTVIDYLKQDLTLWELDALAYNTEIIPLDDLSMQGYTSLTALETMISYVYPEEAE